MAFEVEPGFVVGDGKLSLVAGPCVIESRELVQEGARELHGICGRLDVPLLEILAEVRETFDVPVITDVHDVLHIAAVAEAVDVIQIPAFLCRQTDPMAAAGASGRAVNVKKGQFMAAEDMSFARSTRSAREAVSGWCSRSAATPSAIATSSWTSATSTGRRRFRTGQG